MASIAKQHFSSVCIACVVRFPLLAQLKQTDASCECPLQKYHAIESYSFLTVTIVPTGMWAIVECNVGIGKISSPNLLSQCNFKILIIL